ncbi:MAG: alpha/beta hydrolase [Eggerthellaceae bacterium]|jgi:predicted alpha/beta superfamily hydrolase
MDERFEIGAQRIVLRVQEEGAPIVYVPMPEGDGADVWARCQELSCPPFTMVAIEVLDWKDDLSPWPCPPLTRTDTECAGHAEGELALLSGEIVPAAENRLSAPPSFRAVAGYSLGGLFALWSLYRTDIFVRAASASGSLWFPDFLSYARSRNFAGMPERIYLSLGSKEHKTPNRMLRSVKERTREFSDLLQERGIEHIFEINPGNHFKDEDLRIAKGIAWLLR